MYQRLLNEWLKTKDGAKLFNNHKRDIDLLTGFASWLEETAKQSAQRTTCPTPHPQMDFEFICDLCGSHVPAKRGPAADLEGILPLLDEKLK